MKVGQPGKSWVWRNRPRPVQPQSYLERLWNFVNKHSTGVTNFVTACIVAAATFGQFFYARQQYNFSVELANTQAKDAEKAASAAEAQNMRLLGAADALVATSKSANEAQKLAQESTIASAERSLATVSTNARNDQRAWVDLTNFDSTWPETGTELWLRWSLQNTGRTPARRVITRTDIQFEVPQVPQPPLAAWKSADKVLSVSTVGPNSLHLIQRMVEVTPTQVAAWKASLLFVNLRILTCYEDVFGRRHWVKTCIRHYIGKKQPGSRFTYCADWNEVGDDATSSPRLCEP